MKYSNIRRFVAAAGFVFVAGSVSETAIASPVTFSFTTPPQSVPVELTCTAVGGCLGWDFRLDGEGDATGWGSVASELRPPAGRPTKENIASLFLSTSASLVANDLMKLEWVGSDDREGDEDGTYGDINTFVVTDTTYFWVFDASRLFLFRTASGSSESFEFTFLKNDGGPPSNVGSDGTIQPIPLPGAGFLLLGAVGGLGWLKLRDRKAAA